MESAKKIGDIVLGQEDCKIMGCLARLWDSKNMRSRTADSLISIHGVIIDEYVSVFLIKVSSSYSICKLQYFHLSICFYDRELWYRSQLQKNLRGYSDLFLPKAKDPFVFTNLNVVDIKQWTHTYHHQNYMLQFQKSSKVHRLNSKGEKFPQYAFNFCPFFMLPTKDSPSKPLIGIMLP
jgi:hypothetical protein